MCSRRHNSALFYALDQAIGLQWPLAEASSGLISIADTLQVPSLLKAGMQPSATLLYSAGLVEELAFRAELNDLQESSRGRRYLACMSAAQLTCCIGESSCIQVHMRCLQGGSLSHISSLKRWTEVHLTSTHEQSTGASAQRI